MNKIEKNIENKNPNDLTQVKVGVEFRLRLAWVMGQTHVGVGVLA